MAILVVLALAAVLGAAVVELLRRAHQLRHRMRECETKLWSFTRGDENLAFLHDRELAALESDVLLDPRLAARQLVDFARTAALVFALAAAAIAAWTALTVAGAGVVSPHLYPWISGATAGWSWPPGALVVPALLVCWVLIAGLVAAALGLLDLRLGDRNRFAEESASRIVKRLAGGARSGNPSTRAAAAAAADACSATIDLDDGAAR